MKYYTDTIPVTLAEKLKEKGMSIFIEQEWYPNGMPKDEKDCHNPMTTYAQVFDWLMEKDILIILNPCYNATEDEIVGWISTVNLANKVLGDDFTFGFNYEEHLTWHEAADAAIEKALELI